MRIKLLNENCKPFKKHTTDAGWDLKCAEGFVVSKGKSRPVSLGISVEIPEGHVGLLLPRSGLSRDKGLNLANVVGVIDSDYRGEMIAQVKNNGDRPLRIPEYTRICQLLIVPIVLEDIIVVDELTETDRGSGGFGSTEEDTDEETKQEEEPVLNKKEREKELFKN